MSPDLERKRPGGVLLPTLLILVGVVVAFVIFTGFYTEFMWFDSVEKTQVFTISLVTRAIMFGIMFAIMFVVSSLALLIAFRTRPSYVGATPEQASLERYRVAIEPYRKWIAVAIVFVLSFFAGLAGSGEYGRIQPFLARLIRNSVGIFLFTHSSYRSFVLFWATVSLLSFCLS